MSSRQLSPIKWGSRKNPRLHSSRLSPLPDKVWRGPGEASGYIQFAPGGPKPHGWLPAVEKQQVLREAGVPA